MELTSNSTCHHFLGIWAEVFPNHERQQRPLAKRSCGFCDSSDFWGPSKKQLDHRSISGIWNLNKNGNNKINLLIYIYPMKRLMNKYWKPFDSKSVDVSMKSLTLSSPGFTISAPGLTSRLAEQTQQLVICYMRFTHGFTSRDRGYCGSWSPPDFPCGGDWEKDRSIHKAVKSTSNRNTLGATIVCRWYVQMFYVQQSWLEYVCCLLAHQHDPI